MRNVERRLSVACKSIKRTLHVLFVPYSPNGKTGAEKRPPVLDEPLIARVFLDYLDRTPIDYLDRSHAENAKVGRWDGRGGFLNRSVNCHVHSSNTFSKWWKTELGPPSANEVIKAGIRQGTLQCWLPAAEYLTFDNFMLFGNDLDESVVSENQIVFPALLAF